jgi:hypothetical protein
LRSQHTLRLGDTELGARLSDAQREERLDGLRLRGGVMQPEGASGGAPLRRAAGEWRRRGEHADLPYDATLTVARRLDHHGSLRLHEDRSLRLCRQAPYTAGDEAEKDSKIHHTRHVAGKSTR